MKPIATFLNNLKNDVRKPSSKINNSEKANVPTLSVRQLLVKDFLWIQAKKAQQQRLVYKQGKILQCYAEIFYCKFLANSILNFFYTFSVTTAENPAVVLT